MIVEVRDGSTQLDDLAQASSALQAEFCPWSVLSPVAGQVQAGSRAWFSLGFVFGPDWAWSLVQAGPCLWSRSFLFPYEVHFVFHVKGLCVNWRKIIVGIPEFHV